MQLLFADIPYQPIRIYARAHKSVVLEGEKIGFTIVVYNSDKYQTIPVLHPARQTTGEKLVYFNLYNHQNKSGTWIETESRVMSNAMVHDVPHYPEIVYLKPLDSIRFDVYFNSTYFQTEGHHRFNTPLFAGFYQFQPFYNPFGTVVGDTLYNRLDDFIETIFNAGKAGFSGSGTVYYPIHITILKNPKAVIEVQGELYHCKKIDSLTYAYYNAKDELIEQRKLLPELIARNSDLNYAPPKVINLFPSKSTCDANCSLCYAVKHREEDYLEIQLKRAVRRHKREENGLSALIAELKSHRSIAFVNFAGNMLSSLPSSAYLYVGINSGFDIQTHGLGIQVGRVGKILYYSFKNHCFARKTEVDYLKMRHFQMDQGVMEKQKQLERSNFAFATQEGEKIPEIWPSMEYLFALSNSRPELGILSTDEIKSNFLHQAERFKKGFSESNDPISLCFAAAAGNIYDRTAALRLLREMKAEVALPYLFTCVQILSTYSLLPNRDSYGYESFLWELKKTMESLTGIAVYLPGEQVTIQDLLKEGTKQWNGTFYSVSNLSDGTYDVEILEGTALK